MKIVGIVILVLIGYLVWRFAVRGDALVLVAPDSGKKVTAAVKRVVPGKELVIEVANSSKESRITQISLARALAAQLGMSPPAGFREQPLPLTEDEKKNKDTVDFVARFNKENLRWVGALTMAPDATAEVVFPITSAARPAGLVQFQYESKWGLGGSTSSFRADLGGR